MALSKQQLVQLYRQRAKHYDFSANLYYLIGFREQAARKRAVAALGLRPGDTVLEIGCGTGLNFALFQRAVGESGRIIGVDMSDEMLAQARHRIERHGWRNVELVQQDAAMYQFPPGVNGIFSSFAITLIPEYDQVIRNGAEALAPHGAFVVLDLKAPENWPVWLVKLGVAITRPFGVTLDLRERQPWQVLQDSLLDTSVTEFYGGFAYIAVGRTR